MMDDLISAEEAAQILGVSYRTVIRLAQAGQVEAKLLSKQWVISRESVENLRTQRETRAEQQK